MDIGYRGHHIYRGQENVTLRGPEEHLAYRSHDGHVVHSCGDCEVEVPMDSRSIVHRFYVMDTKAFDFVLGTEFFVERSQILSLTV